MNTFRADLHCHTTCSDGSLTPGQLVRLAMEKGLSGLSITDHDSINAYSEAIPVARELNLPLVSGVEFSASHRGVAVHVLAYGFSLDSPIIHDFCQQHVTRRRERNLAILGLLSGQGLPISEEELYAVDPAPDAARSWGRPHIAQAMIKKGYVRDVEEAFRKYIGDGRVAYAAGKVFSVEDTIARIHNANGFAVLAHPMLIDRNSIVKDLLNMPFDGLEAYYARISPQRQRHWQRIAEDKGWLVTGGSDFHGKIKPTIELGCSWVGQETFRKLEERMHRP